MSRIQNVGRRSVVLVDRENVVAQKNLKTAPFGEFRKILRVIIGGIFSGKGYEKRFYSFKKHIYHTFLTRGTRLMNLI